MRPALLCRLQTADVAPGRAPGLLHGNALRLVREKVLRWCARWAWDRFLIAGAAQPPPVKYRLNRPELMYRWMRLARLWPGLLKLPSCLTLYRGHYVRSLKLRDLLQ